MGYGLIGQSGSTGPSGPQGVSVSAGLVSRPPKGAWEQWFAWHPVTVNGKRKWLTKVWRRVGMYREDMNIYAGYEYGNLFDVIRDKE